MVTVMAMAIRSHIRQKSTPDRNWRKGHRHRHLENPFIKTQIQRTKTNDPLFLPQLQRQEEELAQDPSRSVNDSIRYSPPFLSPVFQPTEVPVLSINQSMSNVVFGSFRSIIMAANVFSLKWIKYSSPIQNRCTRLSSLFTLSLRLNRILASSLFRFHPPIPFSGSVSCLPQYCVGWLRRGYTWDVTSPECSVHYVHKLRQTQKHLQWDYSTVVVVIDWIESICF